MADNRNTPRLPERTGERRFSDRQLSDAANAAVGRSGGMTPPRSASGTPRVPPPGSSRRSGRSFLDIATGNEDINTPPPAPRRERDVVADEFKVREEPQPMPVVEDELEDIVPERAERRFNRRERAAESVVPVAAVPYDEPMQEDEEEDLEEYRFDNMTARDEAAAPRRREPKKRGRGNGKVIVALVLMLVVLAAVGIMVGSRYTMINWKFIPVDAQTLDLRDEGISTVWGVARCKELRTLDLRGNDISTWEYDTFKKSVPQCEVMWDVPLSGGITLQCDVSSSDISGTPDMKMRKLTRGLQHLPLLERIVINDCGFDDDELRELEEKLDGVDVVWEVEIGGQYIMNDVPTLSVSGSDAVSLEEISHKLQYFSSIDSLDLTGCGYSDDELLAYAKKTENATVKWSVKLSGGNVYSDAEQVVLTSSSDVEKLKYFYRMTDLRMSDIGLSDISFVEDITALEVLVVSHNEIADISPLKGLENLVYLDARGNAIADIEPVTSLGKLEVLDLSSNAIKELPKGMDKMKSLQSLTLEHNGISDLSRLSGMESLVTLNLRGNKIKTVEGLKNLDALEELILDSNLMNLPLSDIKVFKKLPSLRRLSLHDNDMWRPYVREMLADMTDCVISVDTKYWPRPTQEG